MPKKMNALDKAIMEGRKLPSKNKKGSVPPDYDVIMPGMGSKKPGKKPGNSKIKGSATPVPLPKKPSNLKPGSKTMITKKPGKKK